MKTVKKIVIYYTDGTYQEVDAIGQAPVFPSGPVKRSAEPAKAVPAIHPLPDIPLDSGVDYWKLPGESGKWPNYPGKQPTIVD